MGKRFWLKRDDLLDKDFDGNKARKFYALLGADLSDYSAIVSIGGAQSNAMYSLSALAKIKNIEFKYYIKKLPKRLKENLNGNLAFALNNGMKLFELDNEEYKSALDGSCALDSQLFIPQGGACEYAKEGLKILAKELNEFCANMKAPKAIISCGTGTSALYLNEYFNGEVYAVPCVGDNEYLKAQFNALGTLHPIILPTVKKYAFGALHADIFDIYTELLNAKVEFDLLYDSVAWIAVKQNLELFDEETVFIHSGGTRGNETMIERYNRVLPKPILRTERASLARLLLSPSAAFNASKPQNKSI